MGQCKLLLELSLSKYSRKDPYEQLRQNGMTGAMWQSATIVIMAYGWRASYWSIQGSIYPGTILRRRRGCRRGRAAPADGRRTPGRGGSANGPFARVGDECERQRVTLNPGATGRKKGGFPRTFGRPVLK